MMKRRRHASYRGELLEARRLLAFDSLVISEFMAANDSVLKDEDGEFSDWIELYNPTDQAVSLQGWSLTDDAQTLDKWSLPDGTLGPHEYQLVFASGKDRRQADSPLHTNFRLDANGEFLGLADPAGELVFSFGDAYPAQRNDLAYGLPIEQQVLIAPDHTGTWRVPQSSDAPLGNSWTAAGFDDASWSDANGALGYDRRPSYPNVGFENGDLGQWSTSGAVEVVGAGSGAVPTQGSWQASLLATESSVTRFNLETFLGLSRASLNSVGNVEVTRGAAMKRTIHMEAGSELALDWNYLTDEPLVNGSQDFAFVSIAPGNLVFKLAGVSDATDLSNTSLDRETGYNAFRYTFSQSGEYTIGLGVVNEANRFLDSGLLLDNLLIDGVGDETFLSVVNTSVDVPLATASSSLWLRQPFSVADASTIEALQFRIRYDDAVVAYLNGQPVARQNAPPVSTWNSLALTDRDDTEALNYQVLSLDVDQLQVGPNLLALHGLKSAHDDLNLLLQTELVGLGQLGENPVFFTAATPARANVTASFGVVDPVQFSVPHGFYEQAFELELSTPTVGAAIRYTLDGSAPTEANSMPYEGPILIDGTATVRAIALKAGVQPSPAITQTYIFIDDVITQNRSSALARGFPNSWGTDITADYEMDRRVIGQNGTDSFNGVYADTVRDDLKAVPTLSLVMNMDDLFGPQGFYSHPFERGVEWERPTSVELIYPDGSEGFQINAGIRIQGGISRFISSKMSMRLLFKDDYGASKLEFPFFGPEAGSTFDSIALRSSSGEHLVGIHFIRDEFVRRSQLMSGNLSPHGTYMHLYINGLYWGLYNPSERVDGQFAANYFGGDKEDYDVLNAGDLGNEGISAVAGSLDAWNQLVELAGDVSEARTQQEKTAAYLRLQGLNPDGTANPQWESYLDVNNYIDYLITQVYARNVDWPIRNYYMLRRRGPDSTGFQFFVWDAEFVLDQGTRDSVTSITRDGPGIIYQLLDTSEAFRVDFSDRVQQHFSPGGAYYVHPDNRAFDPEHPENNVPAALYASLADEVFSPLVGESARWGDETARGGRLFVRNTEWAQTVAFNLSQFFPNRSRDFLADLRRTEFYRDAPALTPPGGLIEPGSAITIQPRSGIVYYTLDGSDPRRPDGTLADTAIAYTGPVPIDERTTLRTRSLNGGEWSALNSATYYTDSIPATPDSLRIAEVNYNPHDALTQVGEADLDGDEFEFIEIVNVTDTAVDLAGVQLVEVDNQGVVFSFGEQRLAAGERVVVGRNRDALVSRYGQDLPLARGLGQLPSQWVFQGRLGNTGETIRLLTADGQLIQQLTYDDEGSWPQRADGGGSSLEVIDLAADLADPRNYRSSDDVGGSPGTTSAGVTPDVVINEVLSSPSAGTLDQVEIFNKSNQAVDVSGWYLTDAEGDLLRFSLPADTELAPGAYWTLDERQLGFGLNGGEGDELFLISADANGRPRRFVDEVHFDASDTNVSLGRWPNGQGQLFPMTAASLGAANSGPLFGDVIISELHYHPQDPDGVGPLLPEVFEYVELYNRSLQPVDLSGWRIAGDTQFVFPVGTSLPAGRSLVVAGFDPSTNPSLVFAFKLSFSAANDLILLGSNQGDLPDTQGFVRLDKPVVPGQATSAWILVDRVSYASTSPWPDDLQGTGKSLQRIAEMAFADAVASWEGAKAAPGSVNFVVGVPGDVTEDGRVDLADVDGLCAALRAGQSATRLDVNHDGQVNHDDFTALISDVLLTHAGDANLDRVFNSSDLVAVFASSEYEDGLPANSTWFEGDWDCDGDFTTGDMVAAFLEGGYTYSSQPVDARTTLQPSFSLSDVRRDLTAVAASLLGNNNSGRSTERAVDSQTFVSRVSPSYRRLFIDHRALDSIWAEQRTVDGIRSADITDSTSAELPMEIWASSRPNGQRPRRRGDVGA
jgi:hypothetical protein